MSAPSSEQTAPPSWCAPWCTTEHDETDLRDRAAGATICCMGAVAAAEGAWKVEVEALVDASGAVSDMAVYFEEFSDGRFDPKSAEEIAAALLTAAALVRGGPDA